jgi:proton glutamate symport protein
MRPRLALHWKILIGLLLGVAVGVSLDRFWGPGTWRSLGVGDPAAFLAGKAAEGNAGAGLGAGLVKFLVDLNWFVGQLFFRSLKFIAVPIVLFSLSVGVASLGDLRRLGRIGSKTLVIFVVTTALSIVIGLTLANLVKPGLMVDAAARDALLAQYQAKVSESVAKTAQVPSLWRQALDLVPENPFRALAEGAMLQVIVFAMAIGAGLTMIPREKADPVIRVFDALTEVILRLVELVMRMAPVAVFALVVPAIAVMGTDVLRAVLSYCLTLVAGLAIVLFGVYPLMLAALAGVGYRRFFSAMAPAFVTAFSSSSSNATLPVTIDCTHKRLGVSERVTSFVCPLGATINMAGTAMYQGVAAAFIAQMHGIPLTLGGQLTIVLTATLAAIGTPGIPGAGVVMLVIVLDAAHVPADGIAVILGVDRLLDMCRTVVNVAGDSATAAVVARSEGELAPAGTAA